MNGTTQFWEHAGLTCALRHGAFGCPCGYVLLPPQHPLHKVEHGDERLCELDVHGGVTWSSWFDDFGEGPHLWAIGFDTAHAGDFYVAYPDCKPLWDDEHARAETERLADQLAPLARDVPAAADEG